jgi:hypothetical protein
MSDDGFVERPASHPANGGRTQMSRLLETATNGKAIVMKSRGGYVTALKVKGWRVHTSIKGAPAGHVIAWVEKREVAP